LELVFSQYKNSIAEAERLLSHSRDAGHGLGHARRVAKDARAIAASLGYEDLDLIEACAWWHDVGRLYNTDHEKLSARLMSQDLKMRGVDYKTRRKAYKAVYKHRWDMEPSTIEGKIIKTPTSLISYLLNAGTGARPPATTRATKNA
jgi:HD superfamily phosphodiesterase